MLLLTETLEAVGKLELRSYFRKVLLYLRLIDGLRPVSRYLDLSLFYGHSTTVSKIKV